MREVHGVHVSTGAAQVNKRELAEEKFFLKREQWAVFNKTIKTSWKTCYFFSLEKEKKLINLKFEYIFFE